MGDPVLTGRPAAAARRASVGRCPRRFYRNGLADMRAVRELAPLPDTADELRAIAKVLGAPPEAINLREAASETRVKAAPLQRVSRHPVRHARAGCRRPVRPRRAGAGADAAGRPTRGRRRPADGLGDRRAEAQRRLGGAVGLQHRGGRRRGRRGAVGPGARLLLCRRAGAAGLALGGLFAGRHRAHHEDLRHAGRRAEGSAAPRPFAAPCWT